MFWQGSGQGKSPGLRHNRPVVEARRQHTNSHNKQGNCFNSLTCLLFSIGLHLFSPLQQSLTNGTGILPIFSFAVHLNCAARVRSFPKTLIRTDGFLPASTPGTSSLFTPNIFETAECQAHQEWPLSSQEAHAEELRIAIVGEAGRSLMCLYPYWVSSQIYFLNSSRTEKTARATSEIYLDLPIHLLHQLPKFEFEIFSISSIFFCQSYFHHQVLFLNTKK